MIRAAYVEDVARQRGRRAAHLATRPAIEVVEWDDGMITAGLARHWIASEPEWLACERRALPQVTGDVLDIGCGGGRVALALQQRGLTVTGLDVSPGAVAVARSRGVADVSCGTVDDHVIAGHTYDTFLLFGPNLGLLQSRERAPLFLAALAAMARPAARVVGQGTNPYVDVDATFKAYQQRNVALGRMPGQMRMRVRYRDMATQWSDYLLCSPTELAELLTGTGWALTDLDEGDSPVYSVVLHRTDVPSGA
jgi:2-polyprenyl-3-methyl-5-hydroxy-6-metoxy-1,4-benzoquinol methylase